MAKYLIPDPVDFHGEWFLPEQDSSACIAGTLSWTSDRAVLQLHDCFTKLRGAIYGDEVYSYPAVHGRTTDSQLVSLLKASSAGHQSSFGPSGFCQSERLVSTLVVVGAHVLPGTLYSEIRVRIPGLQLWIGRSGVRQTILDKTENSGVGVVYYIEGLPEELIDIPCLPATLGLSVDRNFSGDLLSEISVRSFACLRIHADHPQPLDWFFQQLGKATTLLSFLAGAPMSPNQISAKLADEDIDLELLVALREAKYCAHKQVHDFYMLRNDMNADLGETFAKWFEFYDSFATASQLALSVLNSKELWLHVEFLSLMQALEGFHRATMHGKYVPDEDYEPIKQALCNAIPKRVASDHKDALKSRIKYGNELSLRKRLDALVKQLPHPLRECILGGDGTVPRSWVETRNYYTHWDETSRSLVLDGIGMHRAGVRMRHLLRVLYLDLVGVPHAAIAKSLINACDESQYLIQLNSMEYRKKNPESNAGIMMYIDEKDFLGPDESAS